MLRELVNICEHGLIDEEDGRFILNSRQLAWKEIERRLPEIEAAVELSDSLDHFEGIDPIDDRPQWDILYTYRVARELRRGDAKDNSV
jgi:hypothetical protein